MVFLPPKKRAFAQAVSRLSYCNPFLEERIRFERDALGKDFSEARAVWNIRPGMERSQPNVTEILHRTEQLTAELSELLAQGAEASAEDLRLYEDMALFLLYYRYLDRFQQASRTAMEDMPDKQRIPFYKEFKADAMRYFKAGAVRLPAADELPHIFACLFQIRRAFYQIFHHIIGVAAPAVRLRAMVWQSIFTHDMRRYRRSLFGRMGNLTTLVTGPSGTGKELVARAIGLSRYIPFNPEQGTFSESLSGSFLPLNLSALSPTLIESELFGHCRGAFTGAIHDRKGWLEVCPALGTVFLDEIGDLDRSIQVKLLRVLEDRKFQRLGESKDRFFKGKIIAATNRDLAREMQEGRFREDLYYRLCSDIIVTPTLFERIRESEEELQELLMFIARREVGDEAEVLAAEVLEWIHKELGRDYPWSGNIRELEQCVRNILIRKAYHPSYRAPLAAREELAEAVRTGTLTADELMRRYCTLVYMKTRNYEETARRLKLDRRTVKAKIDPDVLKAFEKEADGN